MTDFPQFPGYSTVMQVAGRGSSGTVYEVQNLRLGRTEALKVIRGELAASEVYRQRFSDEARLLARLDHRGIMPIYDYQPEEPLFYTMPYLAGGDLNQYGAASRHAGRNLREVVQIGIQLAEALDYAHAHDIVHGDVKPANVLLKTRLPEQPLIVGNVRQAVLTDFGLATLLREMTRNEAQPYQGTPAYLAPEQCDGQPASTASDLYSLGVVLYELLMGQRPIPVQTIEEALERIPHEPVQPMSGIPAGLERIVMRLLAKQPSRRYPSGQALAEALRPLLSQLPADSSPPPPPPPSGENGRSDDEGSNDTLHLSGDHLAIMPKVFRLGQMQDIVIGSDPACSLVLPNKGIAPRHVKLQKQDGSWWVEQLNGGSVNLGDRKIIDRERWDASQPLRLGNVLLRLNVSDQQDDEAEHFQLYFSGSDDSKWIVEPDEERTIKLVIENNAEERNFYHMTLSGRLQEQLTQDTPWVKLLRDTVEVKAGGVEELAILQLKLPPNALSDSYPFTITAQSLALDDKRVTIAGEVRVRTRARDLELVLDKPEVRSDELLRIKVTNKGNVPVYPKLDLSSRNQELLLAVITSDLAELEGQAGGERPYSPGQTQTIRRPDGWGNVPSTTNLPFGNYLRRAFSRLPGVGQIRSGQAKAAQARRMAEAAQIPMPGGGERSTASQTHQTQQFSTELRSAIYEVNPEVPLDLRPGKSWIIKVVAKPVQRPFFGQTKRLFPFYVKLKMREQREDGRERDFILQEKTGVLAVQPPLRPRLLLFLLIFLGLLLFTIIGSALYSNNLALRPTIQPAQTRALTDTDGDGISDADEVQNETNVREEDSDGDGLPDAVELLGGDGTPSSNALSRTEPVATTLPTLTPTTAPTETPIPEATATPTAVPTGPATRLAEPQFDGYLRGQGSSAAVMLNEETLRVGDSRDNEMYTAVIGFNTAAITGSVDGVTLQLCLDELNQRGRPIEKLLYLVIELAPPQAGSTTDALHTVEDVRPPSEREVANFNGLTLEECFTFSFSDREKGVIPAVVAQNRVFFRLRYELPSNNDNISDYLAFVAADVGAPEELTDDEGNTITEEDKRPLLTVQFR